MIIIGLKKRFGARWAYRCAPAIEAMPLPVFVGAEIIDASVFDAATAVMLCSTHSRASERKYRPARLTLFSDAQARREWKAGVVAMVRSVFGASARPV